jgi:hypothetical protein
MMRRATQTTLIAGSLIMTSMSLVLGSVGSMFSQTRQTDTFKNAVQILVARAPHDNELRHQLTSGLYVPINWNTKPCNVNGVVGEVENDQLRIRAVFKQANGRVGSPTSCRDSERPSDVHISVQQMTVAAQRPYPG